MLTGMRLMFLLLSFALSRPMHAGGIGNAIPPESRQLVLVTAAKWESPRGTLQRFERARSGAPWESIGEAHEALLGERGLAWGRGLHRIPQDGAQQKQEGDRRAPAGIFWLTSAFGQGPLTRFAITRFPYRQISPGTEAVDDSASRFYNRIVDRAQVRGMDWKSSERMAEIADYGLGVVVAHNPRNMPGAGSCIFIHQWRGDRAGTAGCTALREPHLLELVRWLEAPKHPVLVQLPRSAMPPDFP
jgi:D-alanyl-D-alanine dipeptidase